MECFEIELKRVVYEYAEKNKTNHRFDKVTKFANNPNLSLGKPESTSVNRVKVFNRDKVHQFFPNLELLIKRHSFFPKRFLR